MATLTFISLVNLGMSCGIPVTVAGVVLYIWFRRGRYFKRLSKGLCVKCGYDLRGCTGHHCPECGTLIERD